MEAEPLLQSSASADRAVSPTPRTSPDGTAPVATGLSSALPGTAYPLVGRSLTPNSARLGREKWSAGARAHWRDVPVRESWGSFPLPRGGQRRPGSCPPVPRVAAGTSRVPPAAAPLRPAQNGGWPAHPPPLPLGVPSWLPAPRPGWCAEPLTAIPPAHLHRAVGPLAGSVLPCRDEQHRTHRPSLASLRLTSVRLNGSGSCESSSDEYSTGESPR